MIFDVLIEYVGILLREASVTLRDLQRRASAYEPNLNLTAVLYQ